MFRGSMVALVTPMNADNSLDWATLHKLVDWHLEQGTHGIVPMGTTGESPTLDVTEHLEVIRRVVDQVQGRIPVIAGTGSNSTAEAVEFTAAAKDRKADACLLITPYYNKPTQEGLFLHHEFIARQVAIPQILYNVPSRTGVDLRVETAVRLSRVANIVGIKEATGELSRITFLREQASADFAVLSGDDETAVAAMELGAQGEISVTANVAPRQVADMCSAALRGDFAEAQRINERLLAVHRAMFTESNPIPVKWALHLMGLIGTGIRLPLTPLSESHRQPLANALHAAGIL